MQTSKQSTTIVGCRAVGHDHKGRKVGGIYYPKCWKNGRMVPARFEGNFLINGADYKDAKGETVTGRRDRIRIVAWNPKNVADGKGLADTLAKCVSVGKAMTFINVEIQTFLKTIRIDGKVALKADGQPAKTQGFSLVVRGYENMDFGPDSQATVDREEELYNGSPSFFGRPSDPAKWAEERKVRMASTYQPNADTYGYARCIVPEGASLSDPNMQNLPSGENASQADANLPDMEHAGL